MADAYTQNVIAPLQTLLAANSSALSRVSFQFWGQPVYQKSDGTLVCPGYVGDTYLLVNPWHSIYLGIASTQPNTPGKCIVHVDSRRDVDKKKAAGNDGARNTIHGLDARNVEIEIQIWTPEQLRALAGLVPSLFPLAYKGSPPAVDVEHPMFALHGVKSIQVVGMEGPEIDSKGVGTFRMHALEFLKPSKKGASKTEVGSLATVFDAGIKAYPTPGSNSANTGP